MSSSNCRASHGSLKKSISRPLTTLRRVVLNPVAYVWQVFDPEVRHPDMQVPGEFLAEVWITIAPDHHRWNIDFLGLAPEIIRIAQRRPIVIQPCSNRARGRKTSL